MICLNPILKSPALAAFVAACAVLLYFALMSYSPNLPAAFFCSLGVAYIIYNIMGGRLLCDEPQQPEMEKPVLLLPNATPSPTEDQIPVPANALTYKIL